MEISRDSISPWKCPACLQQFKLDYSLDVDTLLSLPFAAVSDESLSDLYDLQGNNHGETSDEEEECRQRGSHLLNLARKLEARSRKDLRVAHLNVYSLRNKMEELKCLQLICKFDILAITETHLDKSVLDMELQIDGMKVLRLDRRERKGGGCVIYYAEYLKATHRKDLARSGLEAIWLQVQFPCTSVLLSVIYRPPDAPRASYDLIAEALEKAWLKTTNIVLLGDFNCDFLCPTDADGATQPALGMKAACLQSVFDSFNMHNVILEATRVTLSSCTLIDLIVTTRKDLITFSGVFPLGISDHSLIYATMNLKKKRPPPKCITVRDYKKLDLEAFRHDLATVPFYVASVFDDADDVQWAWQNLFDNICNHHAPWKQVKIRRTSAP